jgi:hypothetical protein
MGERPQGQGEGFRVEPPTMKSMAGQIASMCPGWRVWQNGRLWHGRRDGGLLDRFDDPRDCHVEAMGIPGLIAAIDAQAELDLAADFPLWAVTRDEAGRWAATFGEVTVRALTAPWLHSALTVRRRPAGRGAAAAG